MRTGSTARYDAPERVFGRARKLARCKRPSRPESRNIATDRCLQSQSRPIPAVANGTSAIPKSTGTNAVPRPTGMRTLLIVDLVACLNPWFPHQAASTPLSGCMRRASRRARHPALRFWPSCFPPDETLRRRVSGWGSGLSPAPVSAFPGAGERPEPQPVTAAVLNTTRRAKTRSATKTKWNAPNGGAPARSRIRRRAPP